MLKNLKKKEQGFTIIEVLIVLAIAGLIMVIVFLAVPSLQRNSRNTQRTADASKVAAAVAQCMSNRNGVVASCATTANLQAAGGLDVTRFSQITTVAPGAGNNPGLINANFAYNQRCLADGSANGGAGATARTAVVTFSIEDGGGAAQGRCIDV